MPQASRDIKRRIKSITSTKKVTKAMEMIAAAKMRKSISAVLASRSYATLSWDLVKRLSGKTHAKLHPLLKERKVVKKAALVLITSNRGLCGGFNAQIIQRALHYVKSQSDNNVQVELVSLGKRGQDFMLKRSIPLVADFAKSDILTQVEEIRPLAKLLINDYLKKKFDKVVLAYTDFVSTLVQKPRIMELLPFSGKGQDAELGHLKATEATTNKSEFEYLFEPSPDQVLEDLLPRLVEVQVYQAILESTASEHSARMVAMQNATEAANDMINSLTLAFNKARQGAITAELADISGGRAAVE
ncbi:MAG: ATP synthase F1 subunit gamma [Candidatus Komeilibacteria bacterium]|nr:ATP synthase F1 subunit gamma [Candidatus Komeilibacteria bacterium]